MKKLCLAIYNNKNGKSKKEFTLSEITYKIISNFLVVVTAKKEHKFNLAKYDFAIEEKF